MISGRSEVHGRARIEGMITVQRRLAGGPLVLATAVLASMLFGGCADPQSGGVDLIDELYVLDAEQTRCISCPSGEIPDPIRALLDDVTADQIGHWIQQRFSTVSPVLNSFKEGDPVQRGLSFSIDQSGGTFFEFEGGRIYYEDIPHWFWDLYKPRMWLVDNHGRRRWKSKVPYASAPVYPFVVGDKVLYIGGTSEVKELVIVDLKTGAVLDRFVPVGERYGFQQSALLFDPAWYSNGYIRLRGTEVSLLDRAARRSIVEQPAKTYVLKVSF
jgi:hypothetical protein